MMQQIQAPHVNEILRVCYEISNGDTEYQMNLLTRSLILAAIEYNVPAEMVMRNFKEMYEREPQRIMDDLRGAGPARTQ